MRQEKAYVSPAKRVTSVPPSRYHTRFALTLRLTGTKAPMMIRRLQFARFLQVVSLTTFVFATTIAQAQRPAPAAGSAPPAPPARQPFAKPGTKAQSERVRTFDVKHVKGEITLDTKKLELRGAVTHTIVPLHPAFDSLTLDCGQGLKVSKVSANGAACGFDHKGDQLVVALDRAYMPDETIDLAVYYSGSPKKGLRFIKPDADHPKRSICAWTIAEPEDARYWLPCFDFPNERSTAEMIVTVDKPLSVVSNGALVSTKENKDGTSTFHWKMDSQLPAYLISVVAAEFNVYHDKLGDLPIDYYVLKEVDEATARRALGHTPKMIEFFNKNIGTPYAFNKYAQVCVPEFGGGMEHSSATTLLDGILVDPIASLESDADSLVAHELAHQWFGDLLTCRDWANLWLNEGFASYFDALFAEHDKGADAFAIAMASNLGQYLGQDRQYRRPIVEPKYNDPWQMFDGVTYAKGACVLHALRGVVGDDAWWQGIKLYVAQHKDQNVLTEDFRAAMEKASGKDLGWFFNQWVFHGGHPELTEHWKFEAEDKTLRLGVEQTQPVDESTLLFRLPTTVQIGDDSGIRTVPIVIDGKSHEFVIPCSTKPKMVRIDPKGWIPKVLTFDKPTDEWIYQLEHSPEYLGRIEAARELTQKHKDDKGVAEALSKAWSKEKDPLPKAQVVRELAKVGEPCRDALLDAAKDAIVGVRVAALEGLFQLKLDSTTEALFRSTWENKSEAYGARRAAFGALVKAKVKDKDELVAQALKDSSGNYTFARSALQTKLAEGGRTAREAAVLYSKPGWPGALRSIAIQTLSQQAKDDPEAEKAIVALLDDPSRNVQTTAMFAVINSGIASALPKAEAILASLDGPVRTRLERRIEELKKGKEAPADSAAAELSAKEAGELERQAADLELQARELRNKAEALKINAEKAKHEKK